MSEQLRKMYEDIIEVFTPIKTNHKKTFLIEFEMILEKYDLDNKDYLLNYFRSCIRQHKSNNLGYKQALLMLSNAYKKVYNITI
ncbi:hypothetical protein VPHG_00186 [Vibrio phage 11895-B1]|uniref:hypothetical protein n=1 Tax=Vibrio phage 11895-B1 TaxID=754075 RepID=UPI0002C0DE2D|nr:hypothetical protein VPHG_00186 [Vibrio phage 11895-B1]AGH32249.1 hypothetical protein VPHG_00186 [Vibrio phage 11895-B1]